MSRSYAASQRRYREEQRRKDREQRKYRARVHRLRVALDALVNDRLSLTPRTAIFVRNGTRYMDSLCAARNNLVVAERWL